MAKAVHRPEGTPATEDNFIKDMELAGSGGTQQSPELPDDDHHDAELETLRNTPYEQLTELTGTYLAFNKPGEYFFRFTAMTKFNSDKQGLIDAVTLIGEDNITYVAAQKVLVDSLKKVTTMPCWVRVDYLGKVKGPNGPYDNFKIATLKESAAK